MAIDKLQHHLDQASDERGAITKGSRRRRFRAQIFLVNSRLHSVRETTKIRRYQTLMSESKVPPMEWVFERVKSIPKNLVLLIEAIWGQVKQCFENGTANPEEIKEVREEARKRNYNFRGKVSFAKINPKMKSERSLEEVEAALKKVIGDIEGFDFLSKIPKGKEKNEHTVLIKVGVNWGQLCYPTVTSWESVYAVTKMCLREAEDRGATVMVIVGDESGIENDLWDGTTKKNFEHTKILHAAVLAGLEHAASLEVADPVNFKGAGKLRKLVREGHKVTFDDGDTLSKQMRDMASQAGAEIIGFGSKDEDFIQVQIPAGEKLSRFKEGIFIPKIVKERVTDIINLPKPPGRHLIMGNTGLTGALKNHVGLLKASDRSRVLHGEGGRLLGSWSEHGPGMGFHEKIVEIYLACKDKERFSATDMRQTVSSLGPDIGDTIDVGVVIAAKDPVTLDALAGAFLKKRYEEVGNWFDALKPGGDSFLEYLAGKTWLRKCTPFDLKSHIAANSYRIGPIDLDHIDFKGFETSGFRVRELDAVAGYLCPLPDGGNGSRKLRLLDSSIANGPHREEKPKVPVPLTDNSLKEVELTPRVRHLKDIYFRALPEICIERPGLITRFSDDNNFFKQRQISILDKAKLYRHVLENRKAIVRHTHGYERGPKGEKPQEFRFKDTQLFAGSTTSKFKGVPLYPEFLALSLWPELRTMSTRISNPYQITEEETEKLNHEIFPYWINNNILELARERWNLNVREKIGFGRPLPENVPMKLLERLVFFLASKPECISHTIPDFSRAINEGLRKVIDDAEQEQEKFKTADRSKKQFYEAISEVLKGVITYSKNLAAEANTLADNETDPIAEKELREIADIHQWVPEKPARNFREGLTTLWICWTAIHLENPNAGLSLGRLDQVLNPLYQEDIQRGALDINSAIELLCCLWLKIGDHVPMLPETAEQLFGGNGSNQAITIGGVDKNGKNAVNDLTYLILRAIELMRLRDPNLNARYYSRINPPEYLKRLCEANMNTGATPAIHNDKAVIEALITSGDNLEQARDYGIVGCVEPTSSGRTYGDCAAILLNLTSALELTLYNGRHRHTGRDLLISKETGDPSTFQSFRDFRRAFKEQTCWLVEQATTLDKLFREIHQDFYPTPILSAFFEGPMDKGKDLIQGGAIINSSGATIVGLADVADSLSAIETVVFKERAVSFVDLLDALDKNFEGYESLRMRLLTPDRTPKYGNGNSDADANVERIIRILDDAFKKEERESYRGGKYRVGYWTMTNHAGFGKLMKAFPNGRKDHESFTSGITPVSGVTHCLTKVLNSVAKQPAGCLSNGVALNLKFTPENGDRKAVLDNFAQYIEGYFSDKNRERDGGLEIQFNITSRDTFVDAVAHPEKYPELLVRVSGYTAYFKDLNRQMQKEIIDRTEYLLSSGIAVFHKPFPLPNLSDNKNEPTDLA